MPKLAAPFRTKSDATLRDLLSALTEMPGHEANVAAIQAEQARRAARRQGAV